MIRINAANVTYDHPANERGDGFIIYNIFRAWIWICRTASSFLAVIDVFEKLGVIERGALAYIVSVLSKSQMIFLYSLMFFLHTCIFTGLLTYFLPKSELHTIIRFYDLRKTLRTDTVAVRSSTTAQNVRNDHTNYSGPRLFTYDTIPCG